jgi:hypothetical protein
MLEAGMPERDDPKASSLRSDNAFNERAGTITDPVFRSHPFFDPRDRVQARYEVTVHLAPRQLWLIDPGRVFKGFPKYSGLPSNGICDSLRA